MTRNNSDRREQHVARDTFESNFERIFGGEVERKAAVKAERERKPVCVGIDKGAQSAVIHGTIDEFVSPIDKTVISDRGQLREHNKRHGVTDNRDYSADFMAKRKKRTDDACLGRSPESRERRKQALADTLRRYE